MSLGCRLPEDVMVDILLKLPIKSLLRFRSVCKPWYVRLTSPNFIVTHLRVTNADKLLVVSEPMRSWRCAIRIPAITVFSGDDIAFNLRLWTFPFKCISYVKVFDSCNGLLCVEGIIDRSPAMVLWNPATRQFRYLELRSRSFLGLGFLPDSHDYKLVAYQCAFGEHGKGKTSLWVYTLSSDSWRSTELPFLGSMELRFLRSFHDRAVALNGFFHWVYCVSKKQQTIVSFDLHDEVFGQMAFPDSCGSGDDIIRKLVVLKDCLSVIVYSRVEEIDRSFEIWVMTEYGVRESWTKFFTIRPFSSVVKPVGSWRNGEVIFLYQKDYSCKLFSYDPIIQKTAYFRIPQNVTFFSSLNYVESLESIEGGIRRSCRRFSFMTEYSGTHNPCEKAGEGGCPSDVLVLKFAIPVPKPSTKFHCRLCGELIYLGLSGLQQHLACQGRVSRCPYVSTDLRKEMRKHLGPSQHDDNDDGFDEYFGSSTNEMVIQGQDDMECERRPDSGKEEPLVPKVSKSLTKRLRKKLGCLW